MRTKEKKSHVLRLKLSDRYSTGVVGCALCIGEKTVNFKFSTEYDRPKEIFQNMVSYSTGIVGVCPETDSCIIFDYNYMYMYRFVHVHVCRKRN